VGFGIFFNNLGSFVWWNPQTIYISSNSHPMFWYDYSKRQDKEEALRRRFTQIIDFNKDQDGKTITTQYNTLDEIKTYWPVKSDGQYKQNLNAVELFH